MVLSTPLPYMLILQTYCVLLFDLLCTCSLFVYIILRFYTMFSSLFTAILLRLCLTWLLHYFILLRLILQRKCRHFVEIYTNKLLTFYRHYVYFSVTLCVVFLCRFYKHFRVKFRSNSTDIIGRFYRDFLSCPFYRENVKILQRFLYVL